MKDKKKSAKTFYTIKKTPVILCPPKGAKALLSEGRRLVCIIRHGQTDWNLELRLQGRECVPLNKTGQEQAVQCGELFARAEKLGLYVSEIYSSPLSRAKKTAELISERLGERLRVKEDEGLLERDYGELSGLTFEERRKLFRKGERQAKNVESVASAADRMKRCIANLSEKSSGTAVLVTHGGIINALFFQITGAKIGTGKNTCENCHISLVAAGKNATVPLAYNLAGESFLNYIEELDLPRL